jgi:hypothetical protein
MKTLSETSDIENYLFNRLKTSTKLVFEARLLIDPILRRNVELQQRLYLILILSGRKKIRSEVDKIHQHVFSDPEKLIFQQSMVQLFIKK